ncbi:MAG: hypothetical protein ACUVSU_10390 [Aggregatilineaceae bacterium]
MTLLLENTVTLAAGLTLFKMGVVAVAIALLAAFVIVHVVWHIKSSPIASLADLQERLRSGSPTVVEFYTNL